MSGKLFFFNPTCEMAVANAQVSYMPPAHLAKFETDLEFILLYLGDRKDCIWVRQPIPDAFKRHLDLMGWSYPLPISQLEDMTYSQLALTQLSPWGWSPAVHKKFEQLKGLMDQSWYLNPLSIWKPAHRSLLSRLTGQQVAQLVKESGIEAKGLLAVPGIPERINSMRRLTELERDLSSPILLKTPWSASGRGLFKIRDRNENVENNRWVLSKLKQQGFLMAEPFLNKLQDLSFHFEITNDTISYLGTTFFKSDNDGRFSGCFIGTPAIANMTDFLLSEAIGQAVQTLQQAFIEMHLSARYQGYVGVDAMLFLNDEGGVKLHPCIEVNLRHTMGLLNLFIQKRLHADSRGFWEIKQVCDSEAADTPLARDVVMRDGRLVSGQVALTPPPTDGGFMAVMTLTL
ncbi:hypothetical protein ACT3CD_06410 [Geofilum sp. OHC36d9]|uniref:hypothetical protein n=1 Tax=Geofilum sp. OHC36d9 TaxID=3458413 RepID=UPI004033CDA2